MNILLIISIINILITIICNLFINIINKQYGSVEIFEFLKIYIILYIVLLLNIIPQKKEPIVVSLITIFLLLLYLFFSIIQSKLLNDRFYSRYYTNSIIIYIYSVILTIIITILNKYNFFELFEGNREVRQQNEERSSSSRTNEYDYLTEYSD